MSMAGLLLPRRQLYYMREDVGELPEMFDRLLTPLEISISVLEASGRRVDEETPLPVPKCRKPRARKPQD
jgi:hypothetical protein